MDVELYCNKKTIKHATWTDVQAALEEVRDGEADFTLDIIPRPENGPIGLQVQSEDGNYMPTMLVTDGPVKFFLRPGKNWRRDG